ncbi:hypothetical protein [Novosphingobium sp. AP12]|uniref:hypothetical protein n=1 Tax=Novosphingobium sp. AP12 TaxID=1144305 RepID=UPI000271FAE0|nr:hypothetical protein [Novosphingobium sp. AP12]EJL34202.1 hypothetical protein PMI02_00774 [Novosphingobium sp. AP12]
MFFAIHKRRLGSYLAAQLLNALASSVCLSWGSGIDAQNRQPKTQMQCPRTSDGAPIDPKLRYQLRGSRCEGLYAVAVSSGAAPRIIGFHRRSFPPTAFSSIKRAALSVDARGLSQNISLRAVSTRPKIYYAMDTELREGEKPYTWETTVLSAPSLSMRANELSVIACDNGCSNGPATRYFPVTIQVPASKSVDLGYVIVFQADITLEAVHVTLKNESGSTAYDRKLPGRFPGSWPIAATLGFPKSGTYRVKLDAQSSIGTRVVQSFSIAIP